MLAKLSVINSNVKAIDGMNCIILENYNVFRVAHLELTAEAGEEKNAPVLLDELQDDRASIIPIHLSVMWHAPRAELYARRR